MGPTAKKKFGFGFVVGAILSLVSPALSDDAPRVAVVVNAKNPLRQISKDEIRRIYLGKKGSWDNDGTILVCDIKKDFAIRKVWLSQVLGVTDREYKKIWLRKLLSGEGPAPRALGSPSEIVGFVSDHENAIGYITYPDTALPKGVKVVRVAAE